MGKAVNLLRPTKMVRRQGEIKGIVRDRREKRELRVKPGKPKRLTGMA